MKIKKSLLLFLCILGFLIILYGIFPKPEPIGLISLGNDNTQQSEILPEGKYRKVADIGELYGYTRATNVSNGTYNGTSAYSSRPRPVVTPRPTKPLPYPRIVINYTVTNTDSLQDQIAEKGYKFVVITFEIKNYGYKYFDAYPTKFRIKSSEKEFIDPWTNVSTGNSLDAVVPNGSMTIGDLVFKLNRNQISNPQLVYTDNSYTVTYKKISDRIIGKERNIEDVNKDDIGD